MSLVEFCCSSKDEYSQMIQKAVLALFPFATTYMCETGFLTYESTKQNAATDLMPNLIL